MANGKCELRDRAVSYCEDCTPAYQGRMLSDGLCLHPETEFFTRTAFGETEVYGVRL